MILGFLLFAPLIVSGEGAALVRWALHNNSGTVHKRHMKGTQTGTKKNLLVPFESVFVPVVVRFPISYAKSTQGIRIDRVANGMVIEGPLWVLEKTLVEPLHLLV